MDRNRALVFVASMVGVLLLTTYFTLGGLPGIRHDPAGSAIIFAAMTAIAVPSAWLALRRMGKPSGSVLDVGSHEAQPRRDFANPSVDSAGLPYRLNYRGWSMALRIGGYGLGLAASVGFLLADVLNANPGASDRASILSSLEAAGLAIFCAWRLWSLRAPWLILYPDRLEKRGVTGWMTLGRQKIEGVRDAGSDRSGRWFEIVPTRAEAPRILLRQSLRDDDPVVRRWFTGVRDLTAEVRATEREAILSDARYGATTAERRRRLQSRKTIAMVFNISCVVLAGLIYFAPVLYPFTPIVALVPVAIAALFLYTSDGLIVWFSPTNSRPTVVLAVGPPVALAIWAVLRVHVLDGTVLLVTGALVAVVATVVTYLRLTSARRLQIAVVVGVGAGILGYGAVSLINVTLDKSKAVVVPRTITDKYTSGSKSRVYNLEVASWTGAGSTVITVPAFFYDAVSIGGQVCITNRTGALGVAWYDIGLCRTGTGAPPT